jgi:hypothetical protein
LILHHGGHFLLVTGCSLFRSAGREFRLVKRVGERPKPHREGTPSHVAKAFSFDAPEEVVASSPAGGAH